MRLFPVFLLSLAAGLLQVSFLDRIRIFGAGIDLLLAFTVTAAIALDPLSAVAVGVFSGFLKDSFDAGPSGFNTLIFPLLVLGVSRLNRALSLENRLMCGLVSGTSSLAAAAMSWVLLAYSQVQLPGAFLGVSLAGAVMTASAGALLFPLTILIPKRLPR